MAKLFIYYSLTGNGDYVSLLFRDKGYDVKKVESVITYPKNKFSLMLKGGFRALFSKRDKLKDYDINLDLYNDIVIASPIWASKMTPTINEVLNKFDLSSKNLSFIFYSDSGNSKKAEKKIKKVFPLAKTYSLKKVTINKDDAKKIIDENF